MNAYERVKMVKAMEFIVRNINDESHIYPWLSLGVADGDIDYADLEATKGDTVVLEDYIDDNTFADLMDTFLLCMAGAKESGGLYCDGVVSKEM